MRYYNVNENGNVLPEDDAQDEFINQNVLAIARDQRSLAEEFGVSEETIASSLSNARHRLLEVRENERERPLVDEKIIVAWNGLAIGALARVSSAIRDTDPTNAERYLNCAVQAATFIHDVLYDEADGSLKRVYSEAGSDIPAFPAFADDYAFMIAGL
jgi:uncharacterized protein YyaL (SSP411 family)